VPVGKAKTVPVYLAVFIMGQYVVVGVGVATPPPPPPTVLP
jgi:hypothetical protein